MTHQKRMKIMSKLHGSGVNVANLFKLGKEVFNWVLGVGGLAGLTTGIIKGVQHKQQKEREKDQTINDLHKKIDDLRDNQMKGGKYKKRNRRIKY